MFEAVLICLVFVNIYLYNQITKEQKKVRILTCFIDGLINFSRKVPDTILWIKNNKDKETEENIEKEGGDYIYNDIMQSFEDHYWVKPYDQFIEKDKNLFEHVDFNGGFQDTFSYIHDKLSLNWKKTKEEIEKNK